MRTTLCTIAGLLVGLIVATLFARAGDRPDVEQLRQKYVASAIDELGTSVELQKATRDRDYWRKRCEIAELFLKRDAPQTLAEHEKRLEEVHRRAAESAR